MSRDRLARRTAIRPGAELTGTHDLDAEPRLLETADGHHWDALFVQAPDTPQARTLAIVIHGSVGNYLGGLPRWLAIELARAGVSALTINTRLANFGVIYGGGLFRSAVADIDAAVDDAKALGAEQVALVGYGQGASLAALYQSEVSRPEVAALVHVAHPGHPGRAQRERWDRLGAKPGFAEVEREAVRRDRDEIDDDIFVVARGSGPTGRAEDSEVWTWRTWMDARDPDAEHLDGVLLATRADVPQLLIQPSTPLARKTGAAIVRAADRRPTRMSLVENADSGLAGHTPEVSALAASFIAEVEDPTAPRIPLRAPSTSVHVATVSCRDGQEHDVLFVEEPDATERRTLETGRRTAIVHLHGNQGSFTVGALRYLPHPLAQVGVPVLTLETRLANASQIFGGALFEEALIDIGAAIDTLGRWGFDGVVLSGYSIGANLAARAVAEEWSLPVRAAVLVGAARSLPESTGRRMDRFGTEPPYAELVERCRGAIADGREEVLVVRRLYGPTFEPHLSGVYTSSTWWHSRGPEAVDAVAGTFLAAVTCPVLLVQGTADTLVDPSDATELAGIVRASGGRADIAWIDGADHLMGGHHHQLVDAVRAWVDAHG